MGQLEQELLPLLIRIGPLLVFGMTMVETAAFIGLLVPAEATVLLAGYLAYRGVFGLEHVLAASILGAFAGDQIGYLLGRYGGARMVAKEGLLGRLWRRHEPIVSRLFRRHSLLGISFARFLSFVRTLMPWFAGMSGVSYPRFVVYDLIGVLGWAVGSVALGYLAGESLDLVARWVGGVTAAIIGVALLAAFVAARRARGLRESR